MCPSSSAIYRSEKLDALQTAAQHRQQYDSQSVVGPHAQAFVAATVPLHCLFRGRSRSPSKPAVGFGDGLHGHHRRFEFAPPTVDAMWACACICQPDPAPNRAARVSSGRHSRQLCWANSRMKLRLHAYRAVDAGPKKSSETDDRRASCGIRWPGDMSMTHEDC